MDEETEKKNLRERKHGKEVQSSIVKWWPFVFLFVSGRSVDIPCFHRHWSLLCFLLFLGVIVKGLCFLCSLPSFFFLMFISFIFFCLYL